MTNLEKYFDKLGRKGTDRITGISGVITSLCFDLYGCIQVALNPGLDKDGKHQDSCWYDIQRIATDETAAHVMKARYEDIISKKKPEDYNHGPAEKPAAKN